MEESNLGAKVRQFRITRNMRLRKLVAEAGMTPSMVSQQEEQQEEKRIVRSGNYKIIGHPDEEVVYQLLTLDVSGMIEYRRDVILRKRREIYES